MIKFKVWSIYDNSFLHFPEDENDNLFYNLGIPYNISHILSNPDRFKIFLYTGIPDKFHKQIYDGDIINYKNIIGFVSFFAGMFVCNWNDQTETPLGYMITNDLEIIGHICENLELLNE